MSSSGFPPWHLYKGIQNCPQSGMTSAHRDSTGTGLLFQQEAKTSGRIADELVVLIIHETTELEFLKHLTATSGRRPSRSASPGSSEAAARESARNRSLRANGPTVRIVSDFPTTTACVRSGMGFIPRPHQVELNLERLDLRSVIKNVMGHLTWPAASL